MKKTLALIGIMVLALAVVGGAVAYSAPWNDDVWHDLHTDPCSITGNSAVDIDWCACGMMANQHYQPGGLCA